MLQPLPFLFLTPELFGPLALHALKMQRADFRQKQNFPIAGHTSLHCLQLGFQILFFLSALFFMRHVLSVKTCLFSAQRVHLLPLQDFLFSLGKVPDGKSLFRFSVIAEAHQCGAEYLRHSLSTRIRAVWRSPYSWRSQYQDCGGSPVPTGYNLPDRNPLDNIRVADSWRPLAPLRDTAGSPKTEEPASAFKTVGYSLELAAMDMKRNSPSPSESLRGLIAGLQAADMAVGKGHGTFCLPLDTEAPIWIKLF